MTRALTVTGILGAGTALVFAAAAIASMLFPNGALVPSNTWGGKVVFDRGFAPAPMPAIAPAPDVVVGGQDFAPAPARIESPAPVENAIDVPDVAP